MNKKFFVGSALPPLRVGKKLEWTFDELINFFDQNLSLKEKEQIDLIRGYLDLVNVRQLLRKEPLDPHGKMSEKEIDEALLNQEGFSEDLYAHLDAFDSPVEQERHFDRVLAAFFRKMSQETKGLTLVYFTFERELKLTLVGLRANRLNLDLASELQHEEFSDPLVAELLAQKELKQFVFPFGYQKLGEALEKALGDPLLEHRVLTQFRFDTLDEMFLDRPFSIDAIAGYFIQFMLIEDDNHLSDAEGGVKLSRIAT